MEVDDEAPGAPLLRGGSEEEEEDTLAALAAQLTAPQEAIVRRDHIIESERVTEAIPVGDSQAALPNSKFEHAYKTTCSAKSIPVLDYHVDIIRNIPQQLLKSDIGFRTPSATAGGAAISLSPTTTTTASHQQVEAFLDSLIVPAPNNPFILVDHLDLTGVPISTDALRRLVTGAAALGPWWRLRSLTLAKCNLDLAHLTYLVSNASQTFLWHLHRLDISNNPRLGIITSGDTNRTYNNAELENNTPSLRNLQEFANPTIFMMMRLWRNAPLEYLDLTWTGLSSSALTLCLRMLRSYPLPSLGGGCGVPLHDGTRPNLACLKIGPPADGEWTNALIQEISNVLQTLPKLTVLELHGATVQQRDALIDAWKAKHKTTNLIQASEVRTGVVRLAAGQAAQQIMTFETSPQGHTLPGPDTPVKHAQADNDPHILDDWDVLAASLEPRGHHQQRMDQDTRSGAALPPRQPAKKTGGRENRGSLYDRHDREEKWSNKNPKIGSSSSSSINKHAQNQKRLINERPSTTGAGEAYNARYHADDERMTDKHNSNRRSHPNDGRKRKKSSSRGMDSRRIGIARMYRGGAAEDELPARDIELNSDDDKRSFYSSEDSEEDEEEEEEEEEEDGIEITHNEFDEGRDEPRNDTIGPTANPKRNLQITAQPTTATKLTASEQKFKIKDGELDVDSQLGRIYRAEAKAFVKVIPDDADRKSARAAFGIWDSCAENAWDRHRWDRPSRTQHDEPHVLGQLNKLYDLAKKYGKTFGFPFPKYVPGGGVNAFNTTKKDERQEERAARPIPPSPVITPPDSNTAATTTNAQKLASTRNEVTPSKRKNTSKRQSATRVKYHHMLIDDGGGYVHDSDEDVDEIDDEIDDGFMVSDDHSSGEEGTDEENDDADGEKIKEFSRQKPHRHSGMGDSQATAAATTKKVTNLIESLDDEEDDVAPQVNNMTMSTGIPYRRTIHTNVLTISDSDEDEKPAGQSEEQHRDHGANSGAKKSAAARELARLSAWAWDSRKEQHPPNEAVYGLADGKRERRLRFTPSQMITVFDGGSEDACLLRIDDGQGDDRWGDAKIDDSSSDDDDVPLAAQFPRLQPTATATATKEGTSIVGTTNITTTFAAATPTTARHDVIVRDDDDDHRGIAGSSPGLYLGTRVHQQCDETMLSPTAVAIEAAKALLGNLYTATTPTVHDHSDITKNKDMNENSEEIEKNKHTSTEGGIVPDSQESDL